MRFYLFSLLALTFFITSENAWPCSYAFKKIKISTEEKHLTELEFTSIAPNLFRKGAFYIDTKNELTVFTKSINTEKLNAKFESISITQSDVPIFQVKIEKTRAYLDIFEEMEFESDLKFLELTPKSLTTLGFTQVGPELFQRTGKKYKFMIEFKNKKFANAYVSLEPAATPEKISEIVSVIENEEQILCLNKNQKEFFISEKGTPIKVNKKDLKNSAATEAIAGYGIPLKYKKSKITETTIDGKKMDSIQSEMYPGNTPDHKTGSGSVTGFISKKETLAEVLKRDDEFVRAEGYTHEQLAEPLLKMHNLLLAEQRPTGIVYWNKKPYIVNIRSTRGTQESPFNDGTSTRTLMTITDFSGKKLTVPGLVIETIRRYGFYEGNVPNRVDPKTIIEMFYK